MVYIMHAIKGGWSGRVFAVAASNDSGGRKSRIRRSKEERKAMVESFIKKYQKSNDGNFPSLNLTHKEVGGSFYTVREILREIIQENLVLAPPKFSLEEHDHSGLLEQHPLGSLSMEPQIDLSESDGIHMATDVMPNEYQITSEEKISSSSLQFNGSYPSELENEQITDGESKVADRDEVSDKTSKSYPVSNDYGDTSIEEVSNHTEQLPQPKTHGFENEKFVTGVEVLQTNANPDHPRIANVDQDNNDSVNESSQNFNGPASQRLNDEQYHNKNDHTVDKTKELGERVYKESAVMEILDREKHGAQDVEVSQPVKPYMNSDVVVEKFPLRPVPRPAHDMDGESGKLHKAPGYLEDKAIQPGKRTFTQSVVNEKNEEKLPESTVELNDDYKGEKVVLNLQNPSLESSKSSLASIADLGSKDFLPGGAKASNSTESLTSEDSTAAGIKSSDQDNGSLPQGNNPDKINLGTSEGALKNSTQPESNPFLAFVKAFITSFVKFWTE